MPSQGIRTERRPFESERAQLALAGRKNAPHTQGIEEWPEDIRAWHRSCLRLLHSSSGGMWCGILKREVI